MTVGEVIKKVEKHRPGVNISLCEYLSCLGGLEQRIYTDIISAHEGNKELVPLSEDSEMLVPDMYGDLYCFWMLARIDLANGDTAGYTNNMILYNSLMSSFSDHYTRSHMPKARGRLRWR
ncbi:MAG: hypothetical protein IKT46_00685 [Clostridia bacterium]|nr:hypothetical protein [Clostridia bacterium]